MSEHRRGALACQFETIRRSLAQAEGLPFAELLSDEQLAQVGGVETWDDADEPVSSPWVTLEMFLSQTLDRDHSCRQAVARLAAHLAARNEPECGVGTGGYCKARRRLKDVMASLCQRVTRPGHEKPDGTRTRPRTFRALNPLSPDDIRLLTIIAQPKFGIAGLRNADVRVALFGADPTDDAKELRRRSSAVSRKLALLRAHGLLQKVPKSHHCRVTPKGHQSLTTLLAAANASTTELNKLAV